MNCLEESLQTAYNKYQIPENRQKSINNFLVKLLEKDKDTYEHSLRVGLLASQIGEFLQLDGRALLYSGLLHDVGKLQIDSKILSKKEGFNEQDYKVIQKHVEHSHELLKGIHDFSADVAVRHHQYQDTKYPDVLPDYCQPYSQETRATIDFYAMILALADFYDAATTRINNKQGNNKQLTKAEVKTLVLSKHPHFNVLINELYKNEIFKEDN